MTSYAEPYFGFHQAIDLPAHVLAGSVGLREYKRLYSAVAKISHASKHALGDLVVPISVSGKSPDIDTDHNIQDSRAEGTKLFKPSFDTVSSFA